MRKEVWFGLSIMAAVVIALFVIMPTPAQMTNGHPGLLMLALIVVAIMLGFPTAFTLMGLGTMFTWFAHHSVDPSLAVQQTLDLMVQRAYWVMRNNVLISVPLFVFMGYLVERANLIERLFKSLHLATTRIPGSLAVATVVTCAIFATASGIIGAVVTLMGLLAFPAMLKAGIQHPAGGGRRDCWRHSRHPDSAVGPADPLRCHRRSVGDAALRRSLLPRPHACGTLYRLHSSSTQRSNPASRLHSPRRISMYHFPNLRRSSQTTEAKTSWWD